MIRTAAPPQPTAIDPRKPVSMNVEYFTPIVVNAHLGGTPTDYFDQSPTPGPYVPCTPEKCGPLPTEIYRNNPILGPDGTPRMRRGVKHLEDAPASVGNSFALWGIMGGAGAGTVGLLVGAAIGHPVLGTVLGSLVGGLGAGAIGAHRAQGDRIRLTWDVYPIVNTTYVGYKEEVTPAVQNGVSGYNHHFVPDLRGKKLGDYKIPRIEHYKEKSPV